MTVKELKKRLEKYADNQIVIIYDHDDDFCEAGLIRTLTKREADSLGIDNGVLICEDF